MTAKPSLLATQIAKDPPLVQNAGFMLDEADRQYIDTQILAIQEHLLQSLLASIIGTWGDLDVSSAAVAKGDVLCVWSTGNVTRALLAPITSAGVALGVALAPAQPGGKVRYAVGGYLPSDVTGLGNSAGYVRVNTATARCERVGALSAGDYPLGIVTSAGIMSFERQSVLVADPVTFAEVNAALATADAPIDVNEQPVTNLLFPVGPTDAASKSYVDRRWAPTPVKTGNYTAVAGELVRCNPTGGAFTVTLPTAVGIEGREIRVKNVTSSTNNIAVDPTGAETIDGSGVGSYELTVAGGAAVFISDGANWLADPPMP